MLRKLTATSPALTEIGLLVLRLFAGIGLALAHGWQKFPISNAFVEGVGDLGFPAPAVFAWAAALSEFVGGLLLAAGLLTRVAALLVLCTMLTAAFLQHAGQGFGNQELALLYAAIALVFLLGGGGRFSVDRFLR